MTAPAEIGPASGKARDRSIALVVVGIALLMPPLVGVSLVDGSIVGVPVPLVYVFVVWVTLIAAAAALARVLRSSDTIDSSESVNDATG